MWICWAARARSGKRITSGPVGPSPRVTENMWPCPYPRLRAMSGWRKTFESHRSAHRGIDRWDVISGRGPRESAEIRELCLQSTRVNYFECYGDFSSTMTPLRPWATIAVDAQREKNFQYSVWAVQGCRRGSDTGRSRNTANGRRCSGRHALDWPTDVLLGT